MTTRLYRCSQQELYTIAELAWHSAEQHMPAFTDFKPKYNPVFIATKLADLENARMIPSDDERTARVAVLRIELADANRACLNNMQRLKSYIMEAFPEPHLEVEYTAAGLHDFEKATHRNWDVAEEMLGVATRYISGKLSVLIANQIMPPSFPQQFETARVFFSNLHHRFLDAKETSCIKTEEKIIMNNKIFSDLRLLFTDGQKIFRDDDAIRQQFTLTDLLYLTHGAGTAGLKGIITDAHSGRPISHAILTIMQTHESDITSDEGKYQLSPMAHGTYSIRIAAEGYAEKIIPEQEVHVGRISTCHIQLSPAA